MAITFNGLASGLDTASIITDLVRFSQQRIDTFKVKEQEAVGLQNVMTTLKSRLQSLQEGATALSRPQQSVFDRRSITSSDESILTAAAGSAATAGTQTLRVLSVAQNHQIASQGFDDANSQITQGTFQIQAGGNSATITIDSSNNTLTGLSRAINSAGIGVSATVINDGSDSLTQPYRLLLSSNNTGTDNSIKITNNLATDDPNAFRPDFAATHIGQVVAASSFSSTSAIVSNSGAGSYTGTTNETFTFTIQNSGTVGTDDGLQVAYSNANGTKTGTLTIGSSDADVAKLVIDGVQVTFGAGTLVAGDKFSIDTFAPEIQQTTNAQVQIGSGAGAITVQSSKNQISDLIPGVTLNLQSADPTKEIRLTTANDVDAAKQEIMNYVQDYNDFMSYLAQQTKFDAATGVAAPLAGNRAVLALRDQLQRSMLSSSSNLTGTVNRLSSLGITTDERGKLSVNEGRLTGVLNGSVAGASFADVRRLFTLRGDSSSAGIEFVAGSSKSKDSGTVPYQVDITQAAEQASISAANELADLTTLDSSNNQLVVRVDGSTDVTVTLTEGNYTALSLSRELKSRLNQSLSALGRSADVTLSGQKLALTSDRYGAASEVSIISGSGLSVLGFNGTESDYGQDVAGQFIVNGQVETATGLGQLLTSENTNANTADIALRVTLTSSQLQVGSDATLSVTHGLASQLNDVLENMLDPVSGRLRAISDVFSKNADEAQAAALKEAFALDERKASLSRQFADMEQTLSRLKSNGDFATSSLSSLVASSKK